MADKLEKMEAERKDVIVCPTCKKGLPCCIETKSRKDILFRIARFQSSMRQMKAKDSLLSIVGEIAFEIIRLRKVEETLRGYEGLKGKKYLPPGYSPPSFAVCPSCNRNVPCSVSGRKNRIDILDRVTALQGRLKDRKTKEPLYRILQDALMEIRRVRGRVKILQGKK